MLTEYLKKRTEKAWVDDEAKSAIVVASYDCKGNTIVGTLKAGEFGITAELEDMKTGAKKTRTKDDCQYIPLFFLVEFKPGQNEAIVILQRFGTHGAKSALHGDLQTYVGQGDDAYMVEINNLATEKSIKEALGGQIKAIRYIRSTVPDDIANALNLDDNNELLGELQLVIKTKTRERIGFTKWMTDIANGKIDKSQYLEIQGIKFDDVKLDVDVSKRSMTIDLEDIAGRFRSSIDVTEQVKLQNGHPTFKSILTCARNMLPDLRSSLKWK